MEGAAVAIRQLVKVVVTVEQTTRRTKANGEQLPPQPTNGAPQLVRDHLERCLLDPRDRKFPISSYQPVPENSSNLKNPRIRPRMLSLAMSFSHLEVRSRVYGLLRYDDDFQLFRVIIANW